MMNPRTSNGVEGHGGAEAPRKLKLALRRSEGERGFALLVIFLVAAGIMISLYLEMPRVAFESQRNREEMLMERGEQYARAVEVFYRKNKRYPGKLEDLENTNNLRFLRRRYRDPLTGKDEWRIIHMGPAGQLADSLVEKPGQQKGQQLAGNGTQQPTDPNGPTNPEEMNVAMNRVRPSDRNPGRGQLPGSPGYDPNNPNNSNGQQQQQQVDANGNPIYDQNQNPGPNQSAGFNPNGQQPGQQNGYNQPQYPNFPGQQQPNFPGQQPAFQGPAGVNPGGVFPGQTIKYQNPQGFSPGAQLQGQLAAQGGINPAAAGFGQNPALNAINNQLRNQAGFPQPGQPGGFVAGQIPPGAIRLPDGTYKMPDGMLLNADGTPKYQDPNQFRQPAPNGGGPNNPFGNNPSGANGVAGNGGFNGNGFNNNGLGNQPGANGGQNSFGQPISTSQPNGQSFGGAGIAGVASNQVGVGIKVYNERKKYKEWEFIFDYRKPKTKPTTGVGGNGLNQSNLNLSGPSGRPDQPPAGRR